MFYNDNEHVAVFVESEVIADHKDDFIKETLLKREEALKEKGVIYFELLSSKNNENMFITVEVYISHAAIVEHKKTKHYKRWYKKVKNWLKRPRQHKYYSIIK